MKTQNITIDELLNRMSLPANAAVELSIAQAEDLRKMLIALYPERAYDAFRQAGDKEGLSAARDRLVESNPERAYDVFSYAGDKKGLSLLVDSLTKKYNLPSEVVKTIIG